MLVLTLLLQSATLLAEFVHLSDMNGHMKPFGQQHAPEVETDVLDTVPQPQEFWENYVRPGKPVLFRGAAKHSRAYRLWTEDFLISTYGNLTLRLEARAEDNNRIPIGTKGLGRDSVEHFVKHYRTMDAYVISQIPRPMEKDVSIPPCLRCGSFAERIQEVHLFLSARGGKTVIHRDPYSTIHCVFNGSKIWYAIDPSQTHLIYPSDESTYEWGGYSVVDVDAVDLDMFPKLKKIKYSKIEMSAGDCLFMPGGYWHQVRSWGSMNTAVSIWFSRMDEYSNHGCSDVKTDFTPMNEVMVLWRYSGYGELSQGHMDLHILRRLLVTSADVEGRIHLKAFTDHFFRTDTKHRKKLLQQSLDERAQQLISHMDPEGTGFITKEQVESLTIDEMKKILLFFDPSDVSNSDEFEYSHIDVDEVESLLEASHQGNGLFDKDAFVKGYTENLGGTEEKANEILKNLGATNSVIPQDRVNARMMQALHKYHNAMLHDPSFERKLYQHFQKLKHDEL